MDNSLNVFGSLLPVILIGISLVILIAVAFSIYMSRTKQFHEQENATTSPPPHHHFDYQPETKPEYVLPSTARPTPFVRVAEVPKPKDIDFTTTCNNMTESLVALSERYTLDNFTIATADCLIFESTSGDAARNDAAIYSELFKKNPLAETPGITLFGLNHKGSDLIGIIHTEIPLPQSTRYQIETDLKVILNHWV
ncbi:MAG: hypothetical protein WCH85_08465 [Methanomicrobiales archaeon]